MPEKVATACGRSLSKSNIAKHRRACAKCRNVRNIKNLPERCEFDRLRARIEELERNPKVVNNYNNFIVNILPFSEELTLSQAEIKSLLEPASESVPKYVKLKHFTYGHGNVKIPNKSQNRIQVFSEINGQKTWVTRDKKTVIDEITGNSIHELADKYKACELSQTWKNWVHQYTCSDNKTQQELSTQVMYTIMDNQ